MFPAIARYVRGYGYVEIGDQEGFGFVVRAIGYGGLDFEDDTPDMTRRRLRQANLFGPAGFVSADDGEVIEFSQRGFEQKPSHRTIAELGGRDCEDADHMVTETLIRGMYRYWRTVMEAP